MNQVFKALSDPTRRAILDLLRKDNKTAGEIASYFDISKASISHHLNILKQADLVSDEKKGQFVLYSLNSSVFEDLLSWMFNLSNKEDDSYAKK